MIYVIMRSGVHRNEPNSIKSQLPAFVGAGIASGALSGAALGALGAMSIDAELE